MRLLNTQTWEMRIFYSEKPEYAILSHTWTDDEVTLQDWQATVNEELDIASLPRFKKIYEFALHARGDRGEVEDTFEWIWVDTCCIDKTSSAELSEAINSMFKWYAESRICYAYLSDISPPNGGLPSLHELKIRDGYAKVDLNSSTWETKFVDSRWFTRGWTLQELIAPTEVLFVCNDWSPIGYKGDVTIDAALQSRTGIRSAALSAQAEYLSRYAVAERMAWASDRVTSREEDMAYCLMGLFDVNMPLLYGEGKVKAFHRLQEAMMKQSQDQSLFAWGLQVESFSNIDTSSPTPTGELPPTLPWQDEWDSQKQHGLLADSPAAFANFKRFQDSDPGELEEHPYAHRLHRNGAPTIVNGGVLLDLVVIEERPCVRYWNNPNFAWRDTIEVALLMCMTRTWPSQNGRKFLAIALLARGNGYYTRSQEVCLVDEAVDDGHFSAERRHVKITDRPFVLEPRDVFFRTFETGLDLHHIYSSVPENAPHRVLLWRNTVLRFRSTTTKFIEFRYQVPGKEKFIALMIEEVYDSELGRHLLRMGIVPHNKLSEHTTRSPSLLTPGVQTHTMVGIHESWETEPVFGLRLRVNYELVGNAYQSRTPLVKQLTHYWLVDLVIKHENKG